MKKFSFYPTMFIAAAIIAGCSSMPKTNSLLEQARSDFAAAESNPKVAILAPVEFKNAGTALNEANASFAENESTEKVEKLAYISKQKTAIAQEAAKQKSSELAVAASAKERDQVRLDQRTNEADKAKMAAGIAETQAALAQAAAADAQLKTQEAEARARQLEAQLAELAAKKTERGLVITLGDVLFNTNMANLKSEGIRTVQKLADILTQNPQRAVLIEGFTDSTGTAAYNQELSERRADSVRTALLGMGISRDRINTRGYGKSHPVAGNDNASDRQLNRRVEIVISDDTGKITPR